MIKRRDYRLLHPRNHDEASDSSSSEDSGSDAEEVESSDDGDWPEESTLAELELEELQKTANVPAKQGSKYSIQRAEAVKEPKQDRPVGKFEDPMVLRTGRTEGVLRCRLCPKTICLSDDTMRAHLASKGHARAAKQFSEGRLKVMLNSDGEEEGAEEGETHAERLKRIIAVTEQETPKQELSKKKQSGRQRQRLRAKKKAQAESKKRGEQVPAAHPEKPDSGFSGPRSEDKVASNVSLGEKKNVKSKDQAVIAESKVDQKTKKRSDNGMPAQDNGKQSKRRKSTKA